MNLHQYYEDIFESSSITMKESLKRDNELAKIHSFVEDLLTWYDVLKTRGEAVILKYAASELQLSALSLVSGLYRQSFTSLRLALELSLSAIFFSSNELEFREWEGGTRDIYWNQLVSTDDNDAGIFSKRWASGFFPELTDYVKNYNTLARDTYRSLSEFVHGNAYTWELKEAKVVFEENLFNQWIDNFSNYSKIISFALCLRFMKHLDSSSINFLEAHLHEFVGHITEVRKFLGWPVEE
ncbi:hypothetical protein PN499_09575 [Kamptonema animale CS-326]|jgi:hypothetical protein|uniref:hypothetical protein n=1 Tax=Kamptonema animale TaxID=92934 RepID=UPI00232ABE1A|nr:hypothetical protein [Kamptonema animale]MDB9511429.1 hypothetical protein [Kamptonema animale CS-326]